MPRQLFTAEDVRRLAHENASILVLRDDDILTQEAVDTAHALGVRVVRETGPSVGAKTAVAPSNLPSLRVVHLANIQIEPFRDGKPTPGTNVWKKDVISVQDRSPVGAGYMSLDKGEVQRDIACDELDIVLEGELIITRGSEQVRGKTGDVIYVPKGSNVILGTPNWARFVYVVFPVNASER
jgi:ethanolamine utilization protein EutQ